MKKNIRITTKAIIIIDSILLSINNDFISFLYKSILMCSHKLVIVKTINISPKERVWIAKVNIINMQIPFFLSDEIFSMKGKKILIGINIMIHAARLIK